MGDIKPINYKIRLEPDLNTFRFSGSTEILIEAANPIDEIKLDILELAVWTCKVKQEDQFKPCVFQCDQEKEDLKIFLPRNMSGQVIVKIDYMGLINDRMAGFYRSKYLSNGKEKYIAVTQFEESDARRAFPCFDQPVAKATFDVEMIVDDALSAISNAPVKEEHPQDDGKKRVIFEQTPVMSTYLLFFGVGEFEFIEDSNRVQVRVATTPGMTKYAEYGLKFGRQALEYCETYYGVPYPLAKLDLIAIPDFAFGAMENWGAITFRENLLLHDPEVTSKAGEERICEVIAHEMAHQWFGNLVTPEDWKYLWLNESFATYFGFGAVHHYHPRWGTWDQFLHSQTDRALERDALKETFPIEIPGGEHVVINSSTAPIIYNKGGSMLRQIKGYMGDEAFQKGLTHYLKAHAYSNTASEHLWEAFETASDKPISQIMKSWVEQQGYPVIRAKREGDELVLTQKRFSYLANETDQTWLVPVTVLVFYADGHSESLTTLLSASEERIALKNDAVCYKVNQGQYGFFRVHYMDKADLDRLGERVSSKDLPPEDRWGLQGDLYALVKSGEASLDEYLAFLDHFESESAFLPLMGIADNLFHAYLVMKAADQERIASAGRTHFDRVLEEIGLEPDPKEDHTVSVLRDQLIWHASVYGSAKACDFALDRFTEFRKGKKIHPDIMKSVLQVGAMHGDIDVFDWLMKRMASSESEHERMNILLALGCFREKELISRVQQVILDEVPSRNKFVPIGSLALNPQAVAGMWDWYVSQIDTLETFHPVHYERVVAAIVPVCGLGREQEVRDFFSDYLSKKSTARDVIKLSLEKLEINARMRAQ